MEGEVPKEIVIEDKTNREKMRLIQELDEKDKGIIFSMIDIMLTEMENAGILTMYSQYKVTTGSQIKLTTPF